MARKTFEEAKEELIDCAVGAHDYEKITTWEELAKWAAFEKSAVDDRASRLQHIMYQSEEEIDEGNA